MEDVAIDDVRVSVSSERREGSFGEDDGITLVEVTSLPPDLLKVDGVWSKLSSE